MRTTRQFFGDIFPLGSLGISTVSILMLSILAALPCTMMSGGSLPETVRASATGGSEELAQTSIAGRSRSPPVVGHLVHEISHVGAGSPVSAVTNDRGGMVFEPIGRNSHHTKRGRSTRRVPPSALTNCRSS